MFTRFNVMHSIIFVLLFAWILAACGTSASPAQPAAPQVSTQAIQPTAPAAPAETQPAPAETQPASSAQPTVAASQPTTSTAGSAAPAAGMASYKIVPGESKVAYNVGETFISQNNRFNLAVGTTPQVTGDIQLDPANPQNTKLGPFTVDISQFQSDSSRRDGYIRTHSLESQKYPQAVFTPTKMDGLPSSYTAGQSLTFKVTGDLKVKETTKPVTFDVTAKLDGSTLTGTATSSILMSDFGVGPISLGGLLNTEDQVKIIFNFVARTS